jgi:hypothetical protein
MAIKNGSGIVTLGESRQALCLEAVLELEALCESLPGLVPEGMECISGPHNALKHIAKRMRSLTGVLVVGLADPNFEIASLKRVVNGTH